MSDQKALPAAQTLEEKVKERVKGFMLDALGDEEIEKLVKQSMKQFVEGYDESSRDSYNRVTVNHIPAQLEKMVREAVFEEMAKRVRESLKSQLAPIIGMSFGSEQVSEAAMSLIKTLGPGLLEGIVKGFAAQMIPSVASAIMSSIQFQPGFIPNSVVRTY